LLALRVRIVAAGDGWCSECTEATLRAWFLEGMVSGLPAPVEAVLAGLGTPAPGTLARAMSAAVDAQLKAATDAAAAARDIRLAHLRGWSRDLRDDDRLEDAIAWAASV
jgi:2-hydroxychromene-2-carboxylate isomerase